jgi:mannose-6-phosphate isomerase-like protein (cupin superfamily)
MTENDRLVDKIDLKTKLESFEDQWSPKIIAALNGQEVKLAKLEGAFEWHSHPDEDELFLVLEGEFKMEFRDHTVEMKKGQIIVVPRGVEHKPIAEKACSVLLFEPEGLMNTGDAKMTERSTTGNWI